MPPRISRVVTRFSRLSRLTIPPNNHHICPICSLSRSLQRATPSRLPSPHHRIRSRTQSTVTYDATIDSTTSVKPPVYSRTELREAFVDLQKHAGGYINISRLQLALRGLDQEPGKETIRVAILGLEDGGASLKKAKELLRLLLADPLKTEEEWERILLEDQQGGGPLFVRVGQDEVGNLSHGGRLVQELHVHSPMLNGHKLEILVLEMDPPTMTAVGAEEGSFTETVLVPTIKIPTSITGRYTSVTTPVHKAIIVSSGVIGAAKLLSYSIKGDQRMITATVDLKLGDQENRSSFPFEAVDLAQATAALKSFRQTVDNAVTYEQNWFASGVPEFLEWLKRGTASTAQSMKPPVRELLASLIRNADTAIQAEQVRLLEKALSARVSSSDTQSLQQGLEQWAENAHTELRDELDIAFNGRRWRKLGWWKLFWRVDDVSMIASDILNQRFLTDSEKNIIFLGGRIAQAGVLKDEISADWAYKAITQETKETKLGSEPPPPKIQDLIRSKDHLPILLKPKPWPLHIPATRAYLSQDSIPALQALAQKLVLQTFTTSSFATLFGVLMYISTLSTGLYEAGSVIALGVVWSLRRMQGKWETARQFWEGEVREEGRKAVRSVEGVVREVLAMRNTPIGKDPELEKAKDAVKRAADALDASK